MRATAAVVRGSELDVLDNSKFAVFDVLGRRVTKTAGGFEYRVVQAGPWMIEDYRRIHGGGGAWVLKGNYVHGHGSDTVVTIRHRDWVDQVTDSDKFEPENLILYTNRIGSLTELTAEDGTVQERYRYEEYGRPTVLDGNGTVLSAAVAGSSFLFTGREYEWETGSFLREDPLGTCDVINVVAYVHANPMHLADPFGTSGVGEMLNNIMDCIGTTAT